MDARKISVSGAAFTIVAAAWIAGCNGSGNDAPPVSESPIAQQPAGTTAGEPAGAPRTAGLAVGDNVAAFDVTTISGELKGQTLCYV